MSQKSAKLDFLPEWKQALRRKYHNMSVLDLKKQKILMVKDLEQINLLLDQMITQQVEQSARFVQDYDKQIQRTKRLQKSLMKSLINFQFMLTGDYSVKANEELTRLNNQVKNMKQQVNKFNRMLSVPMQKDIQICEELQKQVFYLQKQFQQIKAKNVKKRQSITQINQQTQKKLAGIKKLSKQIQKLKEDLQSQGITNDQSSPQNNKSYEDLLIKKQKLLSIIERDDKRYNKDYKSKTKKIQQLEQMSYQIKVYLNQIEQKIGQRSEELRLVRNRKKQTVKIDKSESISKRSKRSRTDYHSEVQILSRKQRPSFRISKTHLNDGNYQSAKQRKSQNYANTQQDQKSNLLPKLYKILGKSKLRIEQDCNLKDLIY